MTRAFSRGLGGLLLLGGTTMCTNEPEFVLPDVRAEGQYIKYSDWGDAPLCESLIGELDAYVEDIAEFLQVSPPPPRAIRYTWVHPDAGVEDPLPCPEGIGGCAHLINGEVQVFAKIPAHSHELVHAVHLLTLPRSHAILQEGLANYLGTTVPLDPYQPDDFPREFQALLDVPRPSTHEEYQIAMHYVGGLIELHGVETFKKLWHAMSAETRAADFSAIHLDIVGEHLAETLLELAQHSTMHWDRAPRFACDGPAVDWWDSGSRVLASDSDCLGPFDMYEPVRDQFLYARRFRTEVPQANAVYLQRLNGYLDPGVYLRRCEPGLSEPGVFLDEDGVVAEISAGTYVFEAIAYDAATVMIPFEISISPMQPK